MSFSDVSTGEDGAVELLNQFKAFSHTSPPDTARTEVKYNFIGVVVPKAKNPSAYKYLPGHSVVESILSSTERRAGHYNVLLRSGDIEVLSHQDILSLKHGSATLEDFKRQASKRKREHLSYFARAMRSERRRTKATLRDGFVDTTSLTLSSDDDNRIFGISGANGTTSSDSEVTAIRRSGGLITRFSSVGTDEGSSSSPETSSDELVTQARVTSQRRGMGGRRRQTQHGEIRSSSRLRRKVPKSMAERYEIDISEAEDAPTGIKYTAAKETFVKLPRSDPFRRRHQAVCDNCSLHDDRNTRGPLVFCQGCTASYHAACLGLRASRKHLVTKVGPSKFVLQCRRCIGHFSGRCSVCKQEGPLSKPLAERLTARQEQQHRDESGGCDLITHVDRSILNQIHNVMFRCSQCSRAWHMTHLPGQLPDVQVSSSADDNGKEEDIGTKRFREYSRSWTCQDCSNAPADIEALVAWRPIDLVSFTPGHTSDMLEEDMKEYLVKWRKLSYFKASWMPGSWVHGAAHASMRHAFVKSAKNLRPDMTAEDAIPEEFLRVDIIFDVKYSNIVTDRTYEIDLARVADVQTIYAKYKGLQYEGSVWEAPPDPKDTERWADFRAAYEDWALRNYIKVPQANVLRKRLDLVRRQDFGTRLEKRMQPSLLIGGVLMDYQKDGLNWLYYMWYKQKNVILADEMGLGKTIQVIAFLATLIEDHNCWPFLVVVPNSTCPNWRREIKKWAPNLGVVTYYGSSAARRVAEEYEMFPDGTLRCHIVVTSYETMIDDKARRIFSSIQWAGLVVDEGQRLKSDKTILYSTLLKIMFPFKVLLTGTPLQNNVRELFNVLQFCDPSRDARELEEKYANLTKEAVAELHNMIRPFFLRRTKAQVLKDLPPMAQIIVPVSMTVLQKKLYKSILARNPELIRAIFQKNDGKDRLKQSERHNLNNILLQLRKCLCHPFIYSKAIEERGVNPAILHRNLVEASSKLQLLDLLLPKLLERGHRVLIFSQFLDNLDIVEDFLDGLGMLHLRLDGSMSSLRKQKQIDLYNAPNSPYFAFLLSTRAGGVGINLATADTVIIMDPDFNPHQDIQALSRCHRIGQAKEVLVFQLMTRASAEEKILQIGRKKLTLDHVLIDRMDADEDVEIDLESILRHGAEALFDDDDASDIRYDNNTIEKLLDRNGQIENSRTGEESSAETQFSFARVWVNDTTVLEDQPSTSEAATPHSGSAVWEKILKERERVMKDEAKAKAETLGRGKRKRLAVHYQEQYPGAHGPPGNIDQDVMDVASNHSDTDFQISDVDSEPLTGEAAQFSTPTPKPAKRRSGSDHHVRPYKRSKVPQPKWISNDVGGVDGAAADASRRVLSRCPACDEVHPVGYCRLKLAGVEHCPLCGIAHFGHSRTCPHLSSEAQVATMMACLKQSTEPRALIEEATKYLRGIRGDLVRRKKMRASKPVAIAQAAHAAGTGSTAQFEQAIVGVTSSL